MILKDLSRSRDVMSTYWRLDQGVSSYYIYDRRMEYCNKIKTPCGLRIMKYRIVLIRSSPIVHTLLRLIFFVCVYDRELNAMCSMCGYLNGFVFFCL